MDCKQGGYQPHCREHENLTGQQLGTVIIIDLEHLSREGITLASIKVISIMLSQLQEMFPDVLRKVLIIHAPIWISTVWSIIHPVLARQTRQKIEFLGADWKEKLQVRRHRLNAPRFKYFRYISTKAFSSSTGVEHVLHQIRVATSEWAVVFQVWIFNSNEFPRF